MSRVRCYHSGRQGCWEALPSTFQDRSSLYQGTGELSLGSRPHADASVPAQVKAATEQRAPLPKHRAWGFGLGRKWSLLTGREAPHSVRWNEEYGIFFHL